jgi:polyferredoxin
MAKLSRPRGLIDFETWNNIERGRRGEPRSSRILRPKTVGLSGAVLALAAGMAVLFAARTSGALSVQHDRDPLAITLADGSVRNAYTIKLLNKSPVAREYILSVAGVDAAMAIVGNDTSAPITVPPDSSESLRVTLTMAAPKDADVLFIASDETGKAVLSTRDKFVGR